MTWSQRTVEVGPFGRGSHLITGAIEAGVPEIRNISRGVAHLFIMHTSASLTVTENCDPDVLCDLRDGLDRLAPEDVAYRHCSEGPDDMPAHIKSALTSTSLTVPIREGRLFLGTWQGICLLEHRNAAGRRQICATLQGEAY